MICVFSKKGKGATSVNSLSNLTYLFITKPIVKILILDWDGFCEQNSNKSSQSIMDENTVNKKSSTVYPNPNNGKFKLTADSEISSIKLYTINGIEIKDFISVKSTEFEFNLSLDAGIYLVKISMKDGEIIEQRIMIE